ncbi:MAG: TraR/DksA C4-type zinc finger protein [Microgenomates group bacterium]|nr:TraR/DksA C4-type zinc finger protein [Microgenomates group bacterium]
MVTKLSKKFLARQKDRLIKEKNLIQKQIEELKKSDPFSDPDHASDNAAVDTDVREQVGHDTIEAQINDLLKKLDYIEIALKKIDRGSYGVCEKCHLVIPLARLKLIPEARFCITCEQKLRK